MSTRNLSIRARLVAAFSILTLLALGLGLLGLIGTQRMRDQALNIETNWLPSMRVLGEIDTLTARTSALVLRHTQATDPALVASIEKDMGRFGQTLRGEEDDLRTDDCLSGGAHALRDVHA